MKKLLIILSFLLLSSSLFGQSEETCYVAAQSKDSEEFDPTLLSNISISLISEFLKEVEPLPPAGISMDTCIYHIDAVKVKETTFVTFKGKNLNSFGDSKLSGPDGFQESVLKALYRALEDKRKLICDAYGEFIEKCGGVVKKIPAEKIETIREMKNKYDLFGKRITVLDTRIERMNNGAVKVVTNPHSIGFDGMYYIVFPPEHSGVKANIIALVGGKWFPTGAHKVGFFASEETCYDEPVVLKIEKDKTKTKGLFVAVGDNGTILTSPDGTTWTKRTSGTSEYLRGVTSGNGLFVTVGFFGTILTSPDGITWTERTSGIFRNLYGVTSGNGLFVTVGESGTILTSPDGNSWTKRTSGTYNSLYDVTYGNNKFVTVGKSGTILTSSDGTTWTSRTSGTNVGLNGVTYGNGLFVTVGWNGTILTSPDGISWTQRTSGSQQFDLYGLTYGNGLFVTVGESGTILTSPDGNSWTKRTSGTSKYLIGVTYSQ